MSDSTAGRTEERFCDVVMKGGITSGVVYPRVVTELAKSFTLKSVGGTSAGAIAAAAAAAAESARVRNPQGDSFAEVGALPGMLAGKNSSGHSNLFTFFQPQPGTSRLFRVLTAALNAPSKTRAGLRVMLAAVIEYGLAGALGAAPGLLLAVLACGQSWSLFAGLSFVTGLVVAVAGGVTAVVVSFMREFGREVPANFFGLCSGMNGEVTSAKPAKGDAERADSKPEVEPTALAIWLTTFLNQAAGLETQKEPLTFGQLWNPRLKLGEQPGPEDGEVRLEMMTTCLTWGRPFRLPFRDDEDVKENRFYFRESEFRQLFPPSVVDWLCAHPRESELPQHWQEQGYVPMPDPWNLPVVVATRMSLSFPILLSAVPLYSYEPRATVAERAAHPPRRCWFSDGGICSNFPMHFFDSPLPRWPTFGINLVAKPEATPTGEMQRGWMPANNGEGLAETWNDLETTGGLAGVFGFVGAIIGTMQNWPDNSLARMPGYRDRISHVPLKPTEGGLNLAMPRELIEALGARGELTGAEFVRRFATDQEPLMNWDNHRWIRLRSLLANLESLASRMEVALAYAAVKSPSQSYEHWLKTTPVGSGPRYPFVTDDQRNLALEMIRRIRDLAQTELEHARTPLETKAPRPRPELRPRPRI